MGAFDTRGVSAMVGCFVSRSPRGSSCSCATSEGAEVDDGEDTEDVEDAGMEMDAEVGEEAEVGEDAINRVPTAGAALSESEERETDPRRNSFRSRDRHSSQNTADVSHGLLQRKHWFIRHSS